MSTDTSIRAKIRSELPAEVFARQPQRSLFIIPLLGIVIGGCFVLAQAPLPWYFALLLSIIVGNFHASMMFFGHEVAHGSVVRSKRLQNLLMYPGLTIFCISPHLWRIWHNGSHHGHTNMAEKDPDNFGTLKEFLLTPSWCRPLIKVAPGSGHWFSALYLFAFFTIQAQGVFWSKSKSMPGYKRLNRQRVMIDLVLMISFWIAISIITGWRGTVFIVLIPMLTANFVVLSYVVTNHMLQSLTDDVDTLSTTLSVTTFKFLDYIHFHFSHHIEHHLFPSMPTSMAPRVRKCLIQHFGDRYLAPPHWKALLMIYQTPRVYDGGQVLIEPYSGRQEKISQIELRLRAFQDLSTSGEE